MRTTLALQTLQTPLYQYELQEVRQAYADLVDALPVPSNIFYSLKANPHVALLQTLRDLGAAAEVSSVGELQHAVDAGFEGGRIIYSGPAKTDAELGLALRQGVAKFSVDSRIDLARLGYQARAHGSRPRVLLRVNPDTGIPGAKLAMCGVPSQFGIDTQTLLDSGPEMFDEPAAPLEGIHFYMWHECA